MSEGGSEPVIEREWVSERVSQWVSERVSEIESERVSDRVGERMSSFSLPALV